MAVLSIIISLISFREIGTFDEKILLRPLWRFGILPLLILKKVSIVEPNFFTMRNIASDDWYQHMLDFSPRDDDVFVVTFPKSGTHLMMQLVTQTVGDAEVDFESVF